MTYEQLTLQLRVAVDAPYETVVRFAGEAGISAKRVMKMYQAYKNTIASDRNSKTIASFTISSDLTRIKRIN
jgi:uncharacterized protein YktA (UPF0223 family)